MRKLFTVGVMLLGLLQPAWADEIGWGNPGVDPESTPVETSDVEGETRAVQEENRWWDLLLDWFDVTDSE